MRPPVTELTELSDDPLRGSSGKKRHFLAEHLGEANEPDFPFTVANEIVASFIGATLGLHVPPVFPHGRGDGTLVLVQMSDRDARMQQGPPATAQAISDYTASATLERSGQTRHGSR